LVRREINKLIVTFFLLVTNKNPMSVKATSKKPKSVKATLSFAETCKRVGVIDANDDEWLDPSPKNIQIPQPPVLHALEHIQIPAKLEHIQIPKTLEHIQIPAKLEHIQLPAENIVTVDVISEQPSFWKEEPGEQSKKKRGRPAKDEAREPSKTNRHGLRKMNWFFTLNNYTESDIAEILEKFKPAKAYLFQEEVGEECGTPHLQGLVMFKNQIALSSLQEICQGRIHWEILKKPKAAIEYCGKMKTRKPNGKYWCRGCREPVDDPFLGNPPYPWQKEVIDYLNQPADRREILWVYDLNGDSGKTALAEYFLHQNPDETVYVIGKASDVKHGLKEFLDSGKNPKIIMWDMPKGTRPETISYVGIEQVKNGLFFNTKYETGMCWWKRPHVVVFANRLPCLTGMSPDRWNINRIATINGLMHLVPANTREEQLKKWSTPPDTTLLSRKKSKPYRVNDDESTEFAGESAELTPIYLVPANTPTGYGSELFRENHSQEGNQRKSQTTLETAFSAVPPETPEPSQDPPGPSKTPKWLEPSRSKDSPSEPHSAADKQHRLRLQWPAAEVHRDSAVIRQIHQHPTDARPIHPAAFLSLPKIINSADTAIRGIVDVVDTTTNCLGNFCC